MARNWRRISTGLYVRPDSKALVLALGPELWQCFYFDAEANKANRSSWQSLGLRSSFREAKDYADTHYPMEKTNVEQ